MVTTHDPDARINYLARMPNKVRTALQALCEKTNLSEHRQAIALLEEGFTDQPEDYGQGQHEDGHTRFTLRIPALLHLRIKAASKRTGISMNRLISACLYQGAVAGITTPDMATYAESTLASHLPEAVFLELKNEAQRQEVSLMEMAAERIKSTYSTAV